MVVSDAQLIEAVLGGEVAAFGELAARYERTLRAVAYGVLGDAHAAADATQDGLIAAYEGLGRLKDRKAFGGWASQIVRRRALRMRAGRRVMVPLDAAAEVADRGGGQGGVGADEERLMGALERLPEGERVVVMLRHFDGHGVREIAGILGEAEGTVSKRLSRAHERLRGFLPEEA